MLLDPPQLGNSSDQPRYICVGGTDCLGVMDRSAVSLPPLAAPKTKRKHLQTTRLCRFDPPSSLIPLPQFDASSSPPPPHPQPGNEVWGWGLGVILELLFFCFYFGAWLKEAGSLDPPCSECVEVVMVVIGGWGGDHAKTNSPELFCTRKHIMQELIQ